MKCRLESWRAGGVVLWALAAVCGPVHSASADANLRPYQVTNWSDRLVVSTTTGTTVDSGTLSATDTLYLDWAVINDGDVAVPVGFVTELYVDGTLMTYWNSAPPLDSGYYIFVKDYSLGSLGNGPHTLRIKTDTTGVVAESNEQDNEYSRQIVVGTATATPSPSVTPIPTLTRTSSPSPSPDPTAGLPNLRPYKHPDWSDKIVVATVTGTTTDSPLLTPDDTLYVDWAIINAGAEPTAVRFHTELWVDGARRSWWYSDPPVRDGYYVAMKDVSIGKLPAGTHTVTLTTDAENSIIESDETDNEYSKTIAVVGTPNLTAYKPTDWSDKIVISSVAGTTTDTERILADDTLYIDWAVINAGNGPTTKTFYTELWIDGAMRTSWHSDPPLEATHFVWIKDYSIGRLTAGEHTVSIKTDSTGLVDESDEQDNEYMRSFVVTPSCAGDCNGDGHVGIDDVVTAVTIALGTAATDRCPAADTDDDRRVTIDEIVRALTAALDGCAPQPS